MPGTVPKPTPALPNAKGPPPTSPQVTGPSHTRRMGDSNPRGLSPNTLSKCLNGGWDVFARVRFRRSARCADGSRDPWTELDREELLPKLLPAPPFTGPAVPTPHAPTTIGARPPSRQVPGRETR